MGEKERKREEKIEKRGDNDEKDRREVGFERDTGRRFYMKANEI